MSRLILAAAILFAVAPVRADDASYYGGRHHGRKMANGQIFNQWSDSCAHRKMPFGTRLKVTARRTGRSVIFVVRDRGPFVRGRVVDLSVAGARDLGILAEGVAPVSIEVQR